MGRRSREIISTMLLKGVGFSKGCVLLFPKKPPPFVPSCLMAIWDAAGPLGIICSTPSMPGTAMGPSKDCTTPWETSRRAMTVETGTKKYNVLRVRSVQKFPRVEAHLLSSPRIRADMTAIPVPALTKFCTPSPVI